LSPTETQPRLTQCKEFCAAVSSLREKSGMQIPQAAREIS
jgi:hypothetical protein